MFLNTLLVTEMVKILDLYVYCFQKRVHIREIFAETEYMSFFIKDDELLEKYKHSIFSIGPIRQRKTKLDI